MRRELSEIIAMVKAGQFDLALQAAQKIEDAWVRSRALMKIAEAMAKVGQKERANQAFLLALKAAQKIENALDRSLTLAEIAKAMAKAGQTEWANQAFQLALQTAQR